MKKRYLTLFFLPVFALASCSGSTGMRGVITNGTTITDQKKQQAADVSSEEKQQAEASANRGFVATATFYFATTESAQGQSATMAMNLGFNMEVDVANPYLKATINGSVGTSSGGQGYSVGVNGVSEARKQTGSSRWTVLSDRLTASAYGQTVDAGEGGLFYSMGQGSSAAGAQYLFNVVTNNLYSWNFDFDGESFDLSQLGDTGDSTLNSLLSKIMMSGDPSTGTFEVGISSPFTINEGSALIQLTKFRYSYQNHLLNEFVTAFSMSYSGQGASANVVYEASYHMTYR